MTTNSRARVELVLEITIGDNWNETATVEQIHKQAISSARGKLRSVLGVDAYVVGDPKVTMILVDVKR